MTPPHHQPNPQAEQARAGFFRVGRHWPLVIVLMLLTHASLMIGTIVYVGSKDDTFVDPEYYAKSVDWDHQREMRQAAQRAGWGTALRTEFIGRDPARRVVELRLTEADGTPIEDATVALVSFHPRAVSVRLDAQLSHEEGGVYRAVLPIDRTGIWVAELTVQRGTVRALLTEDLDVISVPDA